MNADAAAPPGRRAALASMAGGVFLYATLPVFVAASSLSGPAFSFWRLVVGVPVLAVAVAARGRWREALHSGGWRWAAWGGLALGVNQLFVMTAIKATSVADTTLIGTLAPVLTGAFAAVVFRERLGRRFWGWSGLAIAGAALVAVAGAARPEADPWGMVLALLGVVCFVSFMLVAKAGRSQLDLLEFLFGTTLAAAVVVSAYIAVAGVPVTPVPPADWVYVLGVALGAGLFGHLFFTWPMRWLPASIPAVVRLAQPLLAGLMAWWFLGQTITTGQLIGGVLTVASVAGAVLATDAEPLPAA